MKHWLESRWKDKLRYCGVWLTFFVACVLIFQIRHKPLMLTYDSYDYIAASESMFIYFNDRNAEQVPYLHRPPLLPGYLHFFSDKVAAAKWLNIFCFATSLLLCYRIARALQIAKFFVYALVIVIACSYPWLQNHFFLWTEPLFTTLSLFLTYCLMTNRKPGLIIMICLLAFFVRKSGLFLFAGVTTWYIFKRDMRKALIFGTVMLFTFFVWEYVTYSFSEVSTSNNILSYLSKLSRVPYVDAMSSWWLPRLIPLSYRVLIIVLLMLLLIRSKSTNIYFSNTIMQLIWILIVVYFLCLILFFGVPDYFEGERYLSVAIPLVMIAVFSFFNEIYFRLSLGRRKVFLICISLWCLYPISRTISHFWYD